MGVRASADPTGLWMAQQARNLLRSWGAAGLFRYLIRNRDAMFSAASARTRYRNASTTYSTTAPGP